MAQVDVAPIRQLICIFNEMQSTSDDVQLNFAHHQRKMSDPDKSSGSAEAVKEGGVGKVQFYLSYPCRSVNTEPARKV